MSQDLSLIPQDSTEAFINFMANAQNPGGNSSVGPKIVRLDGNTGLFTTRRYDAEKKEMVVEPFGDNGQKTFTGTILLIQWFAKWKYNSTPDHISVRTREFSDFKYDRIKLLKIDYNKPKEEQTVETEYDSYQTFKKEHEIKDTMSDKATSRFDLWGSVYIYVPSIDQIVSYRFKGDTRSAFFDYLNDYKNVEGDEREARTTVQVKTLFGSVTREMPKSSNNESKTYYAGTFKSVAFNTDEELKKVQAATIGLAQWRKSFEKKEELPEIEENVTVHVDEEAGEKEIRLDSIPF